MAFKAKDLIRLLGKIRNNNKAKSLSDRCGLRSASRKTEYSVTQAVDADEVLGCNTLEELQTLERLIIFPLQKNFSTKEFLLPT